MQKYDVIIIGAGASGLMCAMQAGQRGRKVLVLDHGDEPGKKILMAGGGRCNFTNYSVSSDHYISANPHFCKSALSRFTQWDFLDLVQRHGIAFHERSHGQLFCDDSSRQILDLLLNECRQAGVELAMRASVSKVEQSPGKGFSLQSRNRHLQTESLVVATGGLSIPSAGASAFGYRLAEQFKIKVQPTSAGLVPLTWQPPDKAKFSLLAGIAQLCSVNNSTQSFTENLLFTHRGLSGPVILQISNYWQPGEPLQINLLPEIDLCSWLKQRQGSDSNKQVKTVLQELLPKRLLAAFLPEALLVLTMRQLMDKEVTEIVDTLQAWQLIPNGSEGYRTAEVTRGGVDCQEISSKTFAAREVPGLYFIGEVLDVHGWLGGYNLQWAWSSGWCAGQVV